MGGCRAGAERAQSNNPYAHMNYVITATLQNFFSEVNHQYMCKLATYRHFGIPLQKAPPGSALPLPHAAVGATDFVPTANGHPVLDQYVAGLGLARPQQDLVRQAIVQVWNALEEKTRKNNLAAALGLSMTVAMMVVTGKDADDAVLAAEIASINDFLAQSPLWLGMAQPARQQLSDSLASPLRSWCCTRRPGRPIRPASRRASPSRASSSRSSASPRRPRRGRRHR